MTKEGHIAFLLYKELEGKLSEVESRELQSWKMEDPEHEKFFAELIDETGFPAMIRFHHPENRELVRKNIMEKLKGQVTSRVVPLYRRNFFRVAVAACIAALIIVGGYFMFFNKQQDSDTPPIVKISDVEAPQGTKATITLADGRTVLLDSLTSLTQNNVALTKTAEGRIVYSGKASETVYNTLTNPRGSQVIDMQLADGSHVWLNTGSAVTYPVAFIGNERKVSITGEAYFEVSHNSSMPFVVSKADVQVQVLGTHFNVKAYDDEIDIKITLLEGSVKVNKGNVTSLLKPGEQAQVSSIIKVLKEVNLEEVMAWKNGRFQFEGAGIEDVMRQISRWYDVDVQYEINSRDLHFSGGISRQVEVSKVFKMLEATEAIHFRIEGKKVFVLK